MLPATINIFEKAARKAGKILIRDFGEIENLQVSLKGPGDFVTVSDQKKERIKEESLDIQQKILQIYLIRYILSQKK